MSGRKSNDKGHALERAFAAYMKQELGWSKAHLSDRLKGKVSGGSYDCDIRGVKQSVPLKILFVVSTLVVTYECVEALTGKVAFDLRFAVGVLILAVVGSFAQYKHTEQVWVECKARKERIKRKDIQVLVTNLDDVMRLERESWKTWLFRNPLRWERWFVSTSDYDQDALKWARDQGVTCWHIAPGWENGPIQARRVDTD